MEGRCKSTSNKHQSSDSTAVGSNKPYIGHGTGKDNRSTNKDKPSRPKTSKRRTKDRSPPEIRDETRDDNANVIDSNVTTDDNNEVVDTVADNLEQNLKLTESIDADNQNNPDMRGKEEGVEENVDDESKDCDQNGKMKIEEENGIVEDSSLNTSEEQVEDDRRLSREAVVDDEENLRKFEEEFDPDKLSSSALNFDSKAFTGNIHGFIDRMQSDSFARVTVDFPVNDLQNLTTKISAALLEFRNYTLYSQSQLEELRNKITEVKANVTEQLHVGDSAAANDEEDGDLVARKAMEAKLARLHADIAETGVELAKTIRFSAETEKTAVDASLVAEHAAEESQRIKKEMEENQRREEERKQLEIARKVAEERRRVEEEERKAEEEAEKMRILEEKKKHDKDSKKHEESLPWEDWPVFTFRTTEGGSFDQGIACLIRTDGEQVRENSVDVQVMNPLESSFPYEDNEELVSNIINVTESEDCHWKEPIYVAIPHCMSRTSALSREPIVKAEVKGQWKEIPSYDMHFENHKDVKFLQAKLHKPACLAVVTRFKKDHMHVGKRGGKIISTADPRITFDVEPQTFSKKENIQCQVQPVDSASVADIKLRFKHCRGLLTSSAIMNMKWDSDTFDKRIIMTLPCPPNPVKARKAAAIKAAKEAKLKQPERKVAVNIFDSVPKEEPVKKKPEKKPTNQPRAQAQTEPPPEEEVEFKRQEPTRWYMGQYGGSDDDENDNLFLLYSNEKGKWHVVPDMHFSQIRLDLLEFELREPLTRFMVLRTRTTVGPNEAVPMAVSIESYIESRLTQIILKQKSDDPNEIVMLCVPSKESEKTLQKMNEEGYEEGPGASSDIIINEGDVLEVRFRGNIKSEENKPLRVVYNSHMKSSVNFSACELDQYLQKSFQVFKGFAQIYKRHMVLRTPQPSTDSDGEEPNPEDLKPRWEEDWELISELLITLPKEHVAPSKPVEKAPIRLINTSDPITPELLRHFAEDLGDEWKKLAHYLNVRRTRVQAILRNNDVDGNENKEDQVKHDMLMTWVKRVPKGMNKVAILSSALLKCGRRDLAEELRDLEHEFLLKRNRGRHHSAKV